MTDRELLVRQLGEAIGRYGVQCSETKELAPPKELTERIAMTNRNEGRD